jgi:hypothetical protein
VERLGGYQEIAPSCIRNTDRKRLIIEGKPDDGS